MNFHAARLAVPLALGSGAAMTKWIAFGAANQFNIEARMMPVTRFMSYGFGRNLAPSGSSFGLGLFPDATSTTIHGHL